MTGLSVRPTPDRLREALFSVLAPVLVGSVFVDAYAGSGAVGIEALSRGAAKVVLIETNAGALAVIRENLRALAIEHKVVVARGSAARLLPAYPCDIAFIDPPYHQPQEYEKALPVLAASGCRLVVAQHETKLCLSENYGNLKQIRLLRQGDNTLSFFEQTEAR